jgi:23S rRNA pseudouridine2457 synthase
MFQYVLFNKPYGVLCQFSDELGRPTLKDYIPLPAVYPVGRLDIDSEGLLLLTDNGGLNQRLANPRYKQAKVYWAQVEGVPSAEQLTQLEHGVMINKRKSLPAQAKLLTDEPVLWPRPTPIRFRKNKPTSWLELTITEGKNHQVKKMTAAVGLPCLRLVRVALGPLQLGELQPGEYKLVPNPFVVQP